MGLSLPDYCIADAIYNLANSPKSKSPGWCYASKTYLAKFFGIGERSVFRGIQTLLKKKLVEKNPDNIRELRTTEKWYQNVVIDKPGQNGRVLKNKKNRAKLADKPGQNGRVGLKLNRAKLADNNYNKENITTSEVVEKYLKRVESWAYERAVYNPAISRETFRIVVLKAINLYGLERVQKLSGDETNAIQFLKNLKTLGR